MNTKRKTIDISADYGQMCGAAQAYARFGRGTFPAFSALHKKYEVTLRRRSVLPELQSIPRYRPISPHFKPSACKS